MFKRRHESSLGTGGRPTWKKRKILPQQKTHDCCYCIPTGKVSFSRSRIYKQFRIFSATDGYCETEVPQATAEHGNNAKMHAGVISGRSLHLRLRVSILSDVHPTFCKTMNHFERTTFTNTFRKLPRCSFRFKEPFKQNSLLRGRE